MTNNVEEEPKGSDLLSPVCCFAVASDSTPTSEKTPTAFPPVISVIVDPPSPSMSIGNQEDFDVGGKLDSCFRRYSGGSMEKCS